MYSYSDEYTVKDMSEEDQLKMALELSASECNIPPEHMVMEPSDVLVCNQPPMDNTDNWSSAIAQSVDGTWDVDDLSGQQAPSGTTALQNLFEDQNTSGKKAFGSTVDLNSEQPLSASSKTPEKISKSTNSKLHSLLTQRGVDNDQPTLSADDFNNGEDFLPDLESRGDDSALAIDLTSKIFDILTKYFL